MRLANIVNFPGFSMTSHTAQFNVDYLAGSGLNSFTGVGCIQNRFIEADGCLYRLLKLDVI
jgi:hypothetical protein